jgi:cell wall-associated NlpC family hydrolase
MPRTTPVFALAPLALALACASTPPPEVRAREPHPVASASVAAAPALPAAAVRAATAVIGAPYRYGGRTPRGFDCSGLVVYSFGRAGLAGLPHSAVALERRTRPVSLDRLRPGDLLFFDLDGKKTAHVAIYLGDEAFVHAPSSGKRVERVDFEHVYWGERIRRAGRLAD